MEVAADTAADTPQQKAYSGAGAGLDASVPRDEVEEEEEEGEGVDQFMRLLVNEE